MFFNSKSCVGVVISRSSIRAIHVSRMAGESKKDWSFEKKSPIQFFDDDVNDGILEKCLNDVFYEIQERKTKVYTPIQISLPDPIVKFSIFDLESIPRNRNEKIELSKLNLKKALHLDTSWLVCDCHYLGLKNGFHKMLAIGVDKRIVDAITKVSLVYCLSLSVVNMAALYRSNYILNSLTLKNCGVVSLEEEYWSISLWDEDGRIKHVRSQWNESGGGNEGHEMTALSKTIERNVRGYIHGESNRKISKLYLSTDNEKFNKFCEVNDVSNIYSLLENEMSGMSWNIFSNISNITLTDVATTVCHS